jgi:hypothetical protein
MMNTATQALCAEILPALRTPNPITDNRYIVGQLHTGGMTRVQTSPNLVWVIGLAPSGAETQILWLAGRGYHVSRRKQGGTIEALGNFADREAAVACALTA